MITKEIKAKILERFSNKDEKIFVSNILDKVYRFEKVNKIEHTNFLNMNEFNIIIPLLNELKVDYTVYSLNNKLTKKIIFFIPEYVEKNNVFFSNYIFAIKISSNTHEKLLHKDYMGAIYSLGIKHEMIGDIFVNNNSCIVFCLSSVKDYILNNLYKVNKQEVEAKEIVIDEELINLLDINLIRKEYIVSSLRADALLSVVYNLSRSEVKSKINGGDLFINDKNEYYLSTLLKENDIVSFKRCGKLKVGKVIRKTRSDRTVIEIYQYS